MAAFVSVHMNQSGAGSLLTLFEDRFNGGFYNTAADTELWLRGKEASDGATLSANGLAVHALLELGSITGDRVYHDAAVHTASRAGAQLEQSPASMPYLLIRWPELVQAQLPAENAAEPAMQ